MSQFPNAGEETAALQRREALETRPQDRYAGRRKFTMCRRCGGNFGMQSVHRETLTGMTDAEIEALAPWYRCRESLTDDCLYYPCSRCNGTNFFQLTTILDDFVLVPTGDILAKWRVTDPMVPDYAALAAEPEPVLASEDSRDSAEMEG